MPFAGRISGEVRVRPEAMTGRTFHLDAAGQHRWSPLSPRAHVEVRLSNPALQWSGTGYLDSNEGDIPLEASFASWNWSRAEVGKDIAILYEVTPCNGAGASLTLKIDAAGQVAEFAPPPRVTLRPTRWRLARGTRADGGIAHIKQTLEDTPFYARSILDTNLFARNVTAMHESLSLERFRAPIVQAMLPFRMPRIK
jgi:carotenoid 1,2-hydratase